MGRNLYILAAALGGLAIVAVVLSFTGTGTVHQVGSAGDSSLWRTTAVTLFLVGLLVALGGILSTLFEQAARRSETERAKKRRR